MATITNATVLYANTKKTNKFGNYSVTLAINPDTLDDDLKTKVKTVEVDEKEYNAITVNSKYPIHFYDNEDKIVEDEIGRGSKCIVKLELDKRFSKAGSVRLKIGKVTEHIPYISNVQKGLEELDNADLPF